MADHGALFPTWRQLVTVAGLLASAGLVFGAEWDPTLPRDPGTISPFELRVVKVDRAGADTPNAGGSRLPEAGGEVGLTVLLHQLPARGMALLPSPDGRYVAIRDALYDLQSQILVFRATGNGPRLGNPLWWDDGRVVFDSGVVDPTRPGTGHPRLGLASKVHAAAGFWTGQLGRTRPTLYRIEDPAGGELQINHGIAAPGFDLLIARRHLTVGGRRTAGYIGAAIDPRVPAVLAAVTGPMAATGDGIPSSLRSKLLLHLAATPACQALHPPERTIELGAFREALAHHLGGRMLVDRLDADGKRISREPLAGAPTGMLTCRWPEDGLGPLGLLPDRLARWTDDWRRLGWIDAANQRMQRPFSVDGPRLGLPLADGGAVELDLSTWSTSMLTSTMAQRYRPQIMDRGGIPHLYLNIDGSRSVALVPSQPKGRVPHGHLADGGAWSRHGDNLHLLATPGSKLVSLPLGGAGRGWIVSATGGRVAVVFADRILHVDPASGQVLRKVPIAPALPDHALPHPDLTMRAAVAQRRWPLVVLDAPWHTTDIDLDVGTARCVPTVDLCRPTIDKGAAVFYSLRGQLADGRLAFGLSGKLGKQQRRWTMLVDPWDGRPPFESPPLEAIAMLEEVMPGLLAAPCEDGFELWNLAANTVVTIQATAKGAVAVSGDGMVALPRGLANAATVVLDGRRAPIGAFDLVLNRPDILLERLGLAQAGTVDLLREAWRRRVVRLGLDPEALRPPASAAELPAVRILDRPSGLATDRAAIDVRFALDGPSVTPVRVRARIDGITVAEQTIAAGGGENRGGVFRALALHRGINRIEIAPLSANGLGIPDRLVLRRSGPPGRTVVAALGISRYREPGRDLLFAAADARDLATALGGAALVLTDAEATRERLSEVRRHLGTAGIDDLAVIVVAGHGLLDRTLRYRLATHDTDFADPAGRGIALDELLDALRASPARRRLVLLDTCHAGEVEPSEMQAGLARMAAVAGAAARGLRPARTAPSGSAPPASGPTPGQAARILFQDAGWDDGITILAASRGDQASWESPAWGHGAFTAAILEAGRERRADLDGDGAIDLAELGAWLDHRVPELTGGQQHPEVRAGDLDREVTILPARGR